MTDQTKTPEWVTDVLNKYQDGVAHAFVLHFNVSDYVIPGMTLKQYLSEVLKNRDVILFYNRSEGITFANQSMEKNFRMVTGLTAQEQSGPLAALQQSRGQQAGQDGPPLPRDPSQALRLIESFLRQTDEKAAIIIEYAESIVPASDIATMSPDDRTNLVTLTRWGSDPQFMKSGHFIFLATATLSAIHDSIKAASSKWESIEIPLPNFDERLGFIEWYLGSDGFDFTMEMEASQLASVTAGLSLINIEDIFLRAATTGKLTFDMVKDRKTAIIKGEYGEVLEVLDPQGGFETVGGLEYVKDYFTKSIINPIQVGNFKRVPMGVLMTGPAGTGKTIMAEAVAREAGINAVALRIGGQIASKWQGEGERNLMKALTAIRSLAPTLVFVDEIDQVVGRGSGENQQDSRIFQLLLDFMSQTDHRGHVVILAATNRPDLMDAALRRPGRFDDKIPFPIPTAKERHAIFQVMARKYGLGDSVEVDQLAMEITEGWTGAELENATRKAATLIDDEGLEPKEALTQAVQRVRPSTADIDFMWMLALQNTSDLDLLPPEWRDKAISPDLEDEIKKARPDDDNGPTRRQKREL